MSAVLEGLVAGLDGDIQRQVRSRVTAMQRHLSFLLESEQGASNRTIRRMWTYERLEILCELNSFYQIVVGPLASATRASRNTSFGNQIPIKFGEIITFDAIRNERVRRTAGDFMRRMRLIGVRRDVLTATRADDLLRALNSREDNEADREGPDEFDS
jgi:hypothetical protein